MEEETEASLVAISAKKEERGRKGREREREKCGERE